MSQLPELDTDHLERLLLDSLSEDHPPAKSKQALLLGLGLGGSALFTTTVASGANAASNAASTGAFAKVAASVGGAKATGVLATTLSIAKSLVVGLAIGTAVAGGASYLTSERAAPAVAAAVHRKPDPAPAVVNGVRPRATIALPTADPVLPVATSAASSPHSRPIVAATSDAEKVAIAPVRESDLTREVALLEQAKRVLLGGDAGQSLRLLADHQTEFPHPSLQQEADLLEVQALVSSGQLERARAQAALFRERYPTSTHLSRLNSLVAAP